MTLLRRFLGTSVFQMAGAGLSFLFFALLGQALPPDEYSVYALVMLFSQAVLTLLWEWTGTAFTRFGREEYLRSGSIRGTTNRRLTAAAVMLAVLIVPGVLAWDSLAERFRFLRDETFCGLIALYLVSSILLGLAQQTLQVIAAYERYARVNLAARLTSFLCLLLILATTRPTLVHIFMILTAAQFFGALLPAAVIAKVEAECPAAPDGFHRFALPNLYGVLLSFLGSWISVYLATRYLAPSTAGAYAYAHQGILTFHLNIAVAVAGPILNNHFVDARVAGGDDTAFRSYADRDVHRLAFAWSLFLSVAASALVIVFLLVRGGAYRYSAICLLPLIPAVASLVFSLLWTPLFQSRLWSIRTQVVQTVSLLVTVAVTVALADPRGVILGAAFGFFAQALSMTLFADFGLKRRGGLLLQFLALGPALVTAGLWCRWFHWWYSTYALTAGAAATILYLVIFPLRREERELWMARIRGSLKPA